MRRVVIALVVITCLGGCNLAVTRHCNQAQDCGEIDDAADCIGRETEKIEDLDEECGENAVTDYEALLTCLAQQSCEDREDGTALNGECEDEFADFLGEELACIF